MFDYLSGRLTVRRPTYCVVDSSGVGYRLEIPLSTYEHLPAEGAVKLLTYVKFSDDGIRIFGFATERERVIFTQLVENVQQLGPSKALTILSSVNIEDLARAIEEGDVAFLRRVKGIGEKIAGRLIVELKGKLPEATEGGKGGNGSSLSRDAVSALVTLGYPRSEAEEAVRTVLRRTRIEDVEVLIKHALEHV